MKYNFVVVLKTNQNSLKEIRALSSFEPTVMVSDVGWLAVIGGFEEEDIKHFEHYPAHQDWQTECDWKDLPL